MTLEGFVLMRPVLSIPGRLRVAADGVSIDPACVTSTVDNADLQALDVALALRANGELTRVTCIAAGQAAAIEALTHGLALGADHAIRLAAYEDLTVDPCALGRAIGARLGAAGARLVFAAGGSDDGDAEALPHAIASTLDAACVTNVLGLRLSASGILVERRLEQGRRERWRAGLPAVVALAPQPDHTTYVSCAALAVARHTSALDTIGATACPPLPPSAVALDGLKPPRQRPKRLRTTAAAGAETAHARAAAAGVVARNAGHLAVTGPAADVADEIVSFLSLRGLLPRADSMGRRR